jgi:predicted CxxxxCH...CXXCH cytochrome family protein
MVRATVWAAAAVVAVGALGCGTARAPSGAEANATAACSSCHTGPGAGPPFRDPTGATNPSLASVGAHDAHLHGSIAPDLGCEQCHTVPRTVTDPGHLDPSPTDIRFGSLATTRGAAPTYDPQTRTCAAVYCHGQFPGGNNGNRPVWTGGDSQAECGSCHGLPPATGQHVRHVGATFGGRSIICSTCHGVGTDELLVASMHVNGRVDVTLPAWSPATSSCAQACHGPEQWTGTPPR